MSFFQRLFGSSSKKLKNRYDRVDDEVRRASTSNGNLHDQFADLIEPMLKAMSKDDELMGENVLKYLIKSYTSECLFNNINDCLSQGRFKDIQHYLATILNQQT